ncbi:MAG: acyl carrier protein phosphodiesterase [Bacteroidales bacterium]|jgi:acyl carrier protein phosphodiesterase|nr:DUF479 domain-containing protein [Bacteroidales bacterium]MDI9575136.1 acyl carrier protein phosphodiesterase [Bacteroidota bacterium]MDD2592751.1 acyl carrier protein phosphodiesterase [Bacteroidales bacterium]MDD3755219.1 acyl carrier protein phosphodiesterase [Bacteroidales bacterium]MDY0400346.1 acyl carrier protein phosphodiesterase [Bacteroidales bacterium]
MNILVHLFFAPDDDEVILGNFIADYIRGFNRLKSYTKNIQKGIKLHQWIDNYSDSNSSVKKSIRRLNPLLQHYAPVAVDIIYDHFMANHWEQFATKPFLIAINEFYILLENNYNILPTKAQKAVDHMITNNWLLMYKDISGLQNVFEWMSGKTSFDSELPSAVEVLLDNYSEFENDFLVFIQKMMIDFKNSEIYRYINK